MLIHMQSLHGENIWKIKTLRLTPPTSPQSLWVTLRLLGYLMKADVFIHVSVSLTLMCPL